MIAPLLLAWSLAADPFPFEREEAELSVEMTPAELKAHVHRLASPEFLGRKGDGGDRAAEHIAAAFKTLGLKPAFADSYFQNIPWHLSTPRADGKTSLGRNVAAILPGTDLADEWIILSAHFDHLGVRRGKMYPGADDNASGVAMFLEVAEAFALGAVKPRRTICFLSCDLEEEFLQGSTYFASHSPLPFAKLKAFLVADLLGRSMADVMEEYLFVLGGETAQRFRQLLADVTPEPGLKTARLGCDLVGTRSDYGPFRDRKIPFLFFTTGTHRDYHKPTDLPERLDYAKLSRISRLIAALTARLASDAENPAWDPKGAQPDLAEVASVRLLFDRLLDRPVVAPLTAAQRERVTAARDRLSAMEAAKTVTPADREWLLGTARWAMMNLF